MGRVGLFFLFFPRESASSAAVRQRVRPTHHKPAAPSLRVRSSHPLAVCRGRPRGERAKRPVRRVCVCVCVCLSVGACVR